MLLPTSSSNHIKADEKVGICITTYLFDGIAVTHLFSDTVLWCLPPVRDFCFLIQCFGVCSSDHVNPSEVRSRSRYEHENGYLIFDNNRGEQEVWRRTSDFTAEDAVAADFSPKGKQLAMSARAAAVYRHYTSRGHFWA